MEPLSLDHVALWVADRDDLAAFCCAHLGMHEIARTGTFTLVGSHARHGKLTLFAAPGPREAAPLVRVGLRVHSLAAAVEALPAGLALERAPGLLGLAAPGGLAIALVEDDDAAVDYDLDHVVLRVHDVAAASTAFEELGFRRAGEELELAGARLVLEPGGAAASERPLLNHLGLRVLSADAALAEARERGIEIVDVVDAANTLAVFVRGPDGVVVEFVEHKPGFSLA